MYQEDLLIEKVEQIVSRNLNVIRREVEKEYLVEFSYNPKIGYIWIKHDDEYVYLSTSTQTQLMLSEETIINYTTFKSQVLYGGVKPLTINNQKIEVSGNMIGYNNTIKYLHLPDFLMTQLLYEEIGVKAVLDKVVVEFANGTATVYKHTSEVVTPYYVFEKSFNYNYELADKLAELIGVFDAYKRGLLDTYNDNESEKKALYYLFFPYVSLILYRDLGSTLFPLHIYKLVTHVSTKLAIYGKKVLEQYKPNPLSRLEALARFISNKTILS